MKIKLTLLTVCFMSLGMLSRAQLTTVIIEPIMLHDEAMGNTDIIPAGAVTYHIYANFTNEADYLSAVYGDANCSLQITSTESIFQSSLGSHLGSNINPAFFDLNPELEYDSFVTIGATNSEDPGTTVYALEAGDTPWIGPFEDGGNILIEGADGGLWFVLNETNAENAVAGPDLAVLIAQITTTGELSGQASFQVFDNGDITTVSDALCVPLTNATVSGCTDELACNYNELANLDDASCIYPEEFYDCDGDCINDVDDDGICDELEILGCTDPEACNYNSLATEDDASCIYPEEFYDCDGDCINDADDDGICDELEILGCTDAAACNYNSEATEDDGSCSFGVTVEVAFTDPNCSNSNDGSITLSASEGQEPYTFSWDDGLTGSELTGLGGGSFAYTVSDAAGCETSGSVELVAPGAVSLSISLISPSCSEVEDGGIVVGILSGEGVTLEWISPPDILETGNLTDIGVGDYILVGTDENGCQAIEEIELASDDSGCLFIPTGFTPNNDGYNDTWIIQGSENYPEINVEIFNRWGQSLYSSKGYEEPWDATFEGNRVAMASYYYVITLDPSSEPLTGYFTIKY